MKKFISEFKEFAIKGNMLDLAIGVIIGGAFNTVVKSIVDDLVMPLVGILLGGRDFSALAITIGSAQIKYGMFIQNIVNFFIIAMSLFVMVKAINRLKRRAEAVEEIEEAKEPEKSAEVILLEEIRDALKN